MTAILRGLVGALDELATTTICTYMICHFSCLGISFSRSSESFSRDSFSGVRRRLVGTLSPVPRARRAFVAHVVDGQRCKKLFKTQGTPSATTKPGELSKTQQRQFKKMSSCSFISTCIHSSSLTPHLRDSSCHPCPRDLRAFTLRSGPTK